MRAWEGEGRGGLMGTGEIDTGPSSSPLHLYLLYCFTALSPTEEGRVETA